MNDEDAHLEAQLAVEEGDRNLLYDDATGKTFLKEMTLKGNLTVGTGINLMTGLDTDELEYLELNRITKAQTFLAAYPWYQAQDEVRQVALADLAFNLGYRGLLEWPKFLADMSAKAYPAAVAEIRSNTLWVGQVHPARANRIEQMILTGQWPKDISTGS
jgi:lysozyme